MEAKWNVRTHRASPRTPLFTGVPAHSVKREGIFFEMSFSLDKKSKKLLFALYFAHLFVPLHLII